MSLRADITSALRTRWEQRGLSLEQIARACGLTKPGVHGLIHGRSGDMLDRYEAIASALGARWSVELVGRDEQSLASEARSLLGRLAPELLPELLRVLRAWPDLTTEDQELVAHLAEHRRRPRIAEVVELTPVVAASADLTRKKQRT